MANLVLLEDDESRKLDTLVDTSGGKGLKLGIASKAVAGLTDEAMSHAVATHADSDDFDPADGVVVAAGVLPGSPDTVVRFLVDADGRLQIVETGQSTTATLANVAGSASSVTLQAANAARKGWTIVNDSAAVLYVKCGASAASATSFTIKLEAGDYWELPFNYTGEIRGIWASATGSARLTEFS